MRFMCNRHCLVQIKELGINLRARDGVLYDFSIDIREYSPYFEIEGQEPPQVIQVATKEPEVFNAEGPKDQYEDLTRSELLSVAKERRIPNAAQMNKIDMTSALKQYDALNSQALGEVGGG